jgi:excisionase family DNA binding protein
MTQSEKEVLNVAEAARFLGISERTMRQLIAERRVPFARVGGSLRLRRTASEDLIRDRRAEVEAEEERWQNQEAVPVGEPRSTSR